MKWLEQIWGTGDMLSVLQMAIRAIVVFLIAWVLIRISGRRSFGFGAPLDNIITILLGALLSRGLVGASPFLPIVGAWLLIVLLNRFIAFATVRSERFNRLVNGKKIVLYREGHFMQGNMGRAMVSEEDIRQGVRKIALLDNLDQVDTVYLERDGQISVIKKSQTNN